MKRYEDLHSTQAHDFLDACDRVVLHSGDWCERFKNSLSDIDTHDDRVLLVEYAERVENAREDGLQFTLFLQLGHVFREVVEEMVDNIGRKDFDPLLVRILLCFLVHFDIEAQHKSVLRRFLKHNTRAHNVAFIHWADANVGDRDFHLFEELEEGFE